MKLHIWDTAGHSRFNDITNSYLRAANAVAIVYDVTNAESFSKAIHHIERVAAHATGQNLSLFLVGNKADLADSRNR